MDSAEEYRLLAGARQFDQEALAAIYETYSPALYAYALRLLGDEIRAEECVADVFSRFLRALRGGQGPKEYLRAYLYRVAHNWVTDQYRREPPPPLNLDEDLADDSRHHPERQAEKKILQEQLRGALRRLTPEQRQVVILRYVQDCAPDEVAAALNRPVGAVKALQHRGIAALRKILLKEDEHDSHDT